jgi:hypothetical protein
MKRAIIIGKRGVQLALAAGVALLGAMATAGESVDAAYSAWLGREITIASSSFSDQIPVGGKLTFIYDADDDVVRICTRTAPGQKGPWRMDLAGGCNVALNFTRGTRYCTLEDIKAGDGEVLSGCHRLRSREVALKPSTTRGAVELKDMIVFLLSAERGKDAIAILIDTPSRVTTDGSVVGKF